MLAFIVRRIGSSLIIVLLVSIVVFTLIRMLPGCPISTLIEEELQAAMIAGDVIDPEMQQRMVDELRAYHGLDLPLPVQFVQWLGRMVRGDFGRSIPRGFDVGTEVGRRMVVTIYLGVLTFIVTLIFGILFGTIAAVCNGSLLDNLITSVSNFGMTIAPFLIAIFLVYVFGFLLEIFPIWGFHLPWEGDTWQSIRRTVLPVMTGAIPGIAGLARLTRSSMLDVLNADHVRTAWAKGLREKAVILRHVLKNGLMPIVSTMGAMIRGIFGGSIIIENIFLVPGVGQILVTAMLQNDYNVIQSVTVLITFITVMSNLITDILYGWVDPRIQYS